MGQAVTVANASGDRLYVKIQSSVQFSEKTDFTLSGSTPATAVETTGKVDVEVNMFPTKPHLFHSYHSAFPIRLLYVPNVKNSDVSVIPFSIYKLN